MKFIEKSHVANRSHSGECARPVDQRKDKLPRTSSPYLAQKTAQHYSQYGLMTDLLTLPCIPVKKNEFHSTNPKFSLLGCSSSAFFH
jgi:hypothetical protein